MVDDYAESQCGLAADPRLLQLAMGEAATLPYLGVVLYRLAAHGRAEECERAHAKRRSLGFACVTPAELAAGLVEPCLDITLPVLAEVIGVKDVVFPETHGFAVLKDTKGMSTMTASGMQSRQ